MSEIEFLYSGRDKTVVGLKVGDQQFLFSDFLLYFTANKEARNQNIKPDQINVLPGQSLFGDAVFSLVGDLTPQEDGKCHYHPLSTAMVNSFLANIADSKRRMNPRDKDFAQTVRSYSKEVFDSHEHGFGRATCYLFGELIGAVFNGEIRNSVEWRLKALKFIDTIKEAKIAENLKQEVVSSEEPESRPDANTYEGIPLVVPCSFKDGYSEQMTEIHEALKTEEGKFARLGLNGFYKERPDLLKPVILESLAKELGIKRTPNVELDVQFNGVSSKMSRGAA